MRVLKGRQRSSVRPRGFTFIEVLVVIVLLGIIALIAYTGAAAAYQRARLAGVATELSNYLAQAANEVQKVRCLDVTCSSSTQYMVFVEIGAQNTDGSTPVRTYLDTNSNYVLEVGTDTLVSKYIIPSGIVLSPQVAPNPVDCLYGGTGCTVTSAKTHVDSQNWSTSSGSTTSVDLDDATIARRLGIDFRSRAFQPPLIASTTTTPSMLTGLAKLTLTHQNMVLSSASHLTPLTSFEIRISPAWAVTTRKGVWNGTSFAYTY
jgi:prepilin-type N-terminal cleavage/methylation domain-containing protein